MGLLKIGAYMCFVAGIVLVGLAFVVPAAMVGLLVGAVALFVAGGVDLWFYKFFTPVMKNMPVPEGFEGDPTSLRGSMKMGSALRQEGISKMESATATLKEMNRSNRLREHGLNAKAEVLAIRDTGQLINFDPILEFDLRIIPESGELYHVAGYRQVVSKIIMPRIDIGGSYPAFVDREDHNSLFINWS